MKIISIALIFISLLSVVPKVGSASTRELRTHALVQELVQRFDRTETEMFVERRLGVELDDISGNYDLLKVWSDILAWTARKKRVQLLLEAVQAERPYAFKASLWADLISWEDTTESIQSTTVIQSSRLLSQREWELVDELSERFGGDRRDIAQFLIKELGVELDHITGVHGGIRTWSLVLRWTIHNNRLSDLLQACKRVRPYMFRLYWDDLIENRSSNENHCESKLKDPR